MDMRIMNIPVCKIDRTLNKKNKKNIVKQKQKMI